MPVSRWPGIAASVLGLLALPSLFSFPTLALLLGVVAFAIGMFGRRRLANGVGASPVWAENLIVVGTALGAAVVIATIVLVVATTD